MSDHPSRSDAPFSPVSHVSEMAPVFRLLRTTFVLLAVLAGILMLLVPVDRADVWPLLRVGEQLWNGALMPDSRDWFEFAGAYERSFSLSWLAGAVLHPAFQFNGLAGVSWVLATLVVGAFLLSGVALARRHGGVYAAVLSPLVALSLARPGHSLGPEAFSLVFLAALLCYLGAGRRRLSRWDYLLAPAFFFLWANAGAGVALGLLVLLVEYLVSFAGRSPAAGEGSQPRGEAGKHLLLVLALALVGAFLYAPLDRISSIVKVGLAPFYGDMSAGVLEMFRGAGFPVLLFLVLASAFVSYDRLGPLDRIHLLVLGVAAVCWARSTLLFGLVSVPVLGTGCIVLRERLSKFLLQGSGSMPRFFQSQIIGFHLLASLALLLFTSLMPCFTDSPTFRLESRRFPEEVAAFLRESPVQGRILNSPELGDYLAWRCRDRQKLAFSSLPPIGTSTEASECLKALRGEADAQAVLAKYDCVVLAYPEQEWDPIRRERLNANHLARQLMAVCPVPPPRQPHEHEMGGPRPNRPPPPPEPKPEAAPSPEPSGQPQPGGQPQPPEPKPEAAPSPEPAGQPRPEPPASDAPAGNAPGPEPGDRQPPQPQDPESGWRLVTWDDVAMVFLRHTPDLREFIVRNKLKSCDPVDLKLRTEKPTIEDYHAASGEITSRFCDPERPRNARALYLLGLLQLRATEMAEEELEKEWEDNLRRHQEETQKRLRAAQEDAPAPSAENQPAPQQPGADSPFADRGSQDVRERRARVEEVRRQATIILQRMAGRYTTDRAQVAGGFVNQVKDAVVDLPKLAPNIPESHYLQALCFSRLSTDFYVSSALDAVRKAVRLDPGYLAPRVLLAQLLAASKKESEVLAARAEWKRVLDIDPGNAQARLGLAQMEVAIVGWNEAVKLLEPLAASADGQTPLRSQILRTLAAAYELTDNYEKAAECVARLHEDSRSALFPEGDVSLKAYLDIIEDVRPAGKAGGAPE